MGPRTTDRNKALAPLILVSSLAVYAVSFSLPVFVEPKNRLLGYQAFFTALYYPHLAAIVGFPRGVVYLLYFPCWWANVFYAAAVRRLLDGRRRGVFVPALLATLLGLATLLSFRGLAVRPAAAPSFREGYWLWVGGMALLTLVPRNGGDGWDRLGEISAQKWDD